MLGVFRPRGDAGRRRVAVAGRAEGGARGRRGHRSTNGHGPGGEPQRTRTAWRETHTHTRPRWRGTDRPPRGAPKRPPRANGCATVPCSHDARCSAVGSPHAPGGNARKRPSLWGPHFHNAEAGGIPGPGRRPGGRGGPRGAGVWPLRLLGCTGKVPAFGEDAWGPSHFNRKSAQGREPSRCSPERPRGDAGSAPAASDQVPRGRRHGHAPPQEAQGTGSARVPQTRRAEPKPGAGRPRPTADGGGEGAPSFPCRLRLRSVNAPRQHRGRLGAPVTPAVTLVSPWSVTAKGPKPTNRY